MTSQDFSQYEQYITSIPINPNVGILPIADLQMGSGYGRVPYFPSDILPTVGLVTLFGKNPPNLLRDSHADGAADVYVVNQGGGGGAQGGAVITDTSAYINIDIAHSATTIASWPSASLEYLYAVYFGVAVVSTGGPTDQCEVSELYLTDGSNFVRLAECGFYFDSTGKPQPNAYREVTNEFPVPINAAESLNLASTTIRVSGATAWSKFANIRLMIGNPET